MSEELLRQSEVLCITKMSRQQLYTLRKDGRFPNPKKIGRSIVWKRSEIDEWIEQLPEAETLG